MLRRPALCSFRFLKHRLRAGTVSATSTRCLTMLSEHLKPEVAFTATSKVCCRLKLAACSLCLHACSSPTVPDHPPKPATARGCAPPRTQYHVVGWACHLHSRNAACACRCLAITPPEPASLSLAAMVTVVAGTIVVSPVCDRLPVHPPTRLPSRSLARTSRLLPLYPPAPRTAPHALAPRASTCPHALSRGCALISARVPRAARRKLPLATACVCVSPPPPPPPILRPPSLAVPPACPPPHPTAITTSPHTRTPVRRTPRTARTTTAFPALPASPQHPPLTATSPHTTIPPHSRARSYPSSSRYSRAPRLTPAPHAPHPGSAPARTPRARRTARVLRARTSLPLCSRPLPRVPWPLVSSRPGPLPKVADSALFLPSRSIASSLVRMVPPLVYSPNPTSAASYT
jgi:hypothetical protein